jgi:hypothetical protein
MKNVFKIALVLSVIYSCKGSADSKVPELANEMCGCFESLKTNLSEDAKNVFKEVAKSDKPQETMMTAMRKLKPEDAKAMGEQLQSVGSVSSPVYQCMQDFEKKHSKETTTDGKALVEKVLVEMQKKPECFIGAAILNLNPKK